MGQNIAVVGNYVNDWKVDAPLWLTTDASSYPTWTSVVKSFDFTDEDVFEYKYIIKQVSAKIWRHDKLTFRAAMFNGSLVKIARSKLYSSRLLVTRLRLLTKRLIRLRSQLHCSSMARSRCKYNWPIYRKLKRNWPMHWNQMSLSASCARWTVKEALGSRNWKSYLNSYIRIRKFEALRWRALQLSLPISTS